MRNSFAAARISIARTRRPARPPATVLAAALGALAMTTAALPLPAVAHHVGVYTPRDNDVSANFKQIKFSIQARKFDVALRLFDEGAVRREMRARARALPEGLESRTRAALTAGDASDAEVDLAIVFAALARALALEADAKLAEPQASRETQAATGARFLEAIWRYWNLVDFVISTYDSKAAVAVRLAFDEAEGYLKGAPAARGSGSQSARAAGAPDPVRARASLAKIAQTLAEIIQELSTSTRRAS